MAVVPDLERIRGESDVGEVFNVGLDCCFIDHVASLAFTSYRALFLLCSFSSAVAHSFLVFGGVLFSDQVPVLFQDDRFEIFRAGITQFD